MADRRYYPQPYLRKKQKEEKPDVQEAIEDQNDLGTRGYEGNVTK